MTFSNLIIAVVARVPVDAGQNHLDDDHVFMGIDRMIAYELESRKQKKDIAKEVILAK